MMDPYAAAAAAAAQGMPVPYMVDPMGYPYPVMPPMYVPGPGAPHMAMPPMGPMPPMAPMGSMPMLNLHGLELSPRNAYGREDPNLFIFHLPPDTDDDALHQLFSEFGPIESAKVMVDKNTGESKGYGFVQFASYADAERALSMNGRSVGSKRLSVSFKTPSPRGPSQPSSPRGYPPVSPRAYHHPQSPLSPRAGGSPFNRPY